MLKRRFVYVSLLALLILSSTSFAQRGGGGGSSGRSFSGGSSSSSSRSFSGSSSSSASRTFSGSSNTKSSTGSGSTSKTYGSHSAAQPSKTFSGGGDSSPKTYGSHSATQSGQQSTDHGSHATTKTSSYDGAAVKAYKTAESKAAYKASFAKADAPKTSYTDSKGNSYKLDPKDAKIERLRGQLDQQKWSNRELRRDNYYSSYYGRPAFFGPSIYYRDPFTDVFFYALWDLSIQERTMWIYNHRSEMDNARYQALLVKDAQLEGRLHALESQKVHADPNYTPKGVDPDLVYKDDYVDAVYNPTPHHSGGGHGWTVLGWLCFSVVVLVVIGLVVYYVFVYRW